MTKLHQLADLGQAVWLDYIRRSFITSGELQDLIEMGLRGVTSNPTIFDEAIGGSNDYDEDFNRLVEAGKTAREIFVELAVEDIRRAADLLRPVYDASEGADGFVSLEVDPLLANDTEATLAEVRHLWERVDRPNAMIKIPATKAGLPAISQAISEGINVNVTLIFSLARYGEVMAAFIHGMEVRRRTGNPIDHVASVASFFVSRVDSKVDQRLNSLLDELDGAEAELARSLLGQAAVANAKLAYRQFKSVFLGEGAPGDGKFADLQQHGAHLQRPLWASTSTKNPAYSDIKYVQELIAPHTVNTMPQSTMEAFLDHGEVRVTIEEDLNEAQFVVQSLEDLGISMDQVTLELEEEGVAKFADSYRSLLKTIEARLPAEAPGS